jgi:hypothetical protein
VKLKEHQPQPQPVKLKEHQPPRVPIEQTKLDRIALKKKKNEYNNFIENKINFQFDKIKKKNLNSSNLPIDFLKFNNIFVFQNFLFN